MKYFQKPLAQHNNELSQNLYFIHSAAYNRVDVLTAKSMILNTKSTHPYKLNLFSQKFKHRQIYHHQSRVPTSYYFGQKK